MSEASLYMGTSLIRNSTSLGICLGPYGGPLGGSAVSYERGIPVQAAAEERGSTARESESCVHGYLAHKKQPPPRLGPPYGPRHMLQQVPRGKLFLLSEGPGTSLLRP